MGVFLVLRCFQCRHFQVIQRRKDRKWTCKLCGGRQSIIKVFASSERAKDCRLVVQELNMRRGEVEQSKREDSALAEEKPREAPWSNHSERGDTLGFVECGGQQTHSTLQSDHGASAAPSSHSGSRDSAPLLVGKRRKSRWGDSEGESDFSDGGSDDGETEGVLYSLDADKALGQQNGGRGRRRRKKKKRRRQRRGRELEQDPESSMARLTGKLASQRPPVVQRREPQHSKPKYRAGGPSQKNTKTRSRWGGAEDEGGGQSSESDDDGVQLSAAQFQQKPERTAFARATERTRAFQPSFADSNKDPAVLASSRPVLMDQANRTRSALSGSAQSSPRHAPALPSETGTNDAGDAWW